MNPEGAVRTLFGSELTREELAWSQSPDSKYARLSLFAFWLISIDRKIRGD